MGWWELRNVHCRVYRPVRLLAEDKQLRAADYTDTTGSDIMGRWMPEATGWIDFAAVQPSQVRGTLLLPRGTDVDRGYAIVLWKLRTRNCVREVVSATLSSDAAIGAIALTLSTTVGFEAGDHCVLSSDSASHIFRIRAVSSTQLTLYADQALVAAFSTGDAVAAKSLWRVDSPVLPQGRGPISVAIVQAPTFWL